MRSVLRFQSILLLLRGGVAIAALAVSFAAFGDELPTGYQSYADRPDVLHITPQTHASLSQGESNWSAMRRAHAEVVAQMLELYPNQDLYFLARDSELLYDAARLIARNDPALSRRLHLLNISRSNMRDPHLMEYLAQEGITPERLRNGHRPIFVDTGFSGTIPRVIGEGFPAELRPFLQTHLISSSNEAHPSSRVFLQELSPAARNTAPGAMHGTIVSYEFMPRFTHRSDRFVQFNGRWQAVSPVSVARRIDADGVVSQSTANQYQADLAHYIESREGRDLIQRRRSQWRQWRTLLANGRTNELQRSLRTTASSGQWGESAVRDFVQWSQTNGTRVAPRSNAPLASAQLGLRRELIPAGSMSNKNELIVLYPQWAHVLENPSTQIAHLLDHGGIAQLGGILDVIRDQELQRIAAAQLGDRLERPEVRQLLRAMIEKESPDMLDAMVWRIFTLHPESPYCPSLIQAVIDTGNQTLMAQLPGVFASGRFASHPELLLSLIQHGDQKVLNAVAGLFTSPQWVADSGLIRLLIERGDSNTLRHLARGAMNIHADPSRQVELINLLVDTHDQEAIRELFVVSVHQVRDRSIRAPIFRRIIEAADDMTLMAVLKRDLLSFNHPEDFALISRLIERGGSQVIDLIPSLPTFCQGLSRHPDLFRQVWARLNPQQRTAVLAIGFSEAHSRINFPSDWTDIIGHRLMSSPLESSEVELIRRAGVLPLEERNKLLIRISGAGPSTSDAGCATQAIQHAVQAARAEVGH